jgi:hypothetical protein
MKYGYLFFATQVDLNLTLNKCCTMVSLVKHSTQNDNNINSMRIQSNLKKHIWHKKKFKKNVQIIKRKYIMKNII